MASAHLTSLFAILLIRSGALSTSSPATDESPEGQIEHAPCPRHLPSPPADIAPASAPADPGTDVARPRLPAPPLSGEPPPTRDDAAQRRDAAPGTATTSGRPLSALSATSRRGTLAHIARPGETVKDIGARYDVSLEELAAANDRPSTTWQIESGQRVWVPTTRRDLVPHMLIIRIRDGETWAGLADRLQVTSRALQRWNPEMRGALGGGDTIRCWLERDQLQALRERRFNRGDLRAAQAPTPRQEASSPNVPREVMAAYNDATTHANSSPASMTRSLRKSESVGRTNRGRLVRGVPLPPRDPAFLLVRPSEAWATDYVANALVSALHRFQKSSRYGRPIAIASLSRQHGGRLKPHRSHQSGRDVDVRLPVKDRTRPVAYKPSHRAEIDWDVAWILVRELLETDHLKYVFWRARVSGCCTAPPVVRV